MFSSKIGHQDPAPLRNQITMKQPIFTSSFIPKIRQFMSCEKKTVIRFEPRLCFHSGSFSLRLYLHSGLVFHISYFFFSRRNLISSWFEKIGRSIVILADRGVNRLSIRPIDAILGGYKRISYYKKFLYFQGNRDVCTL